MRHRLQLPQIPAHARSVGGMPRRALLAAGLTAAAGFAHAQAAWPERSIRWVVPFPPAGTADILSRLLAERIAARLGQPVVVDNRAGAGGTVAANLLAQARGDQYMVMVSNFAPHAASPTLFPNVTYDAQRDFTHLGLLGALPMVLAVNPSFPAQDAQALLAMARAQGSAFTLGYGGTGTASHLIGLALQRAAGLDATLVGYRGSAQLHVDVIAGNVPVMFDTLSAAIGHIRAGRMRALAVSSPERSAALPAVPCFPELGLAEAVGMNWFGFCATTGLPPAIGERWVTELRAVLALPEVTERLASLGVEGTNMDPAMMTALVGREVVRWREVIRANNVTPG